MTTNVKCFLPGNHHTNVQWAVDVVIISKGFLNIKHFFQGLLHVKKLEKGRYTAIAISYHVYLSTIQSTSIHSNLKQIFGLTLYDILSAISFFWICYETTFWYYITKNHWFRRLLEIPFLKHRYSFGSPSSTPTHFLASTVSNLLGHIYVGFVSIQLKEHFMREGNDVG